MKSILICASALAFLSGSAFAEDVIIHRDSPDMDRTVVHRSIGGSAVEKKVITHDESGCASQTVKKSNGMGDSISKTESNC